MRQGSGKNVSAHMKTGRVETYTPGVVSQIGESLSNHATDHKGILHGASAPMYEGRGNAFTAPKASCTPHHSGSQGKR